MFKEMKIMKTNTYMNTTFAKRVATMVVAMFMGLTAWGSEWSHTFSSDPTWDPSSGTSRSMTINSATWNVATSNKTGNPSTWGTYGSAQSSGGIKFGDSKNDYYGTTTLSTNYFNSDRVSSVTVNLLINGSKETTISVAQGATTIGNPSYSTGSQWHDFTANTNSGTGGTLTLTITTTQAIFIHSIAVTYTPAPTEPQTVNFNAHGGICGTSSLDEESAGAGVELPAASANVACAAEGWAFYGWAASEVSSSTTTAPTIVGKAGDMYYPTSTTTLHAVYAQGEYTKETSSITSGAEYLIVANSGSGNYVMTDKYSLNSDGRGEMVGVQINESSPNNYHASSVNHEWCYTIEASSELYFIRDLKHNSSSNYLDIAFKDWYGNSPDNEDKYTISKSGEKWTIENDYSYFYFNATNHVFTNNPEAYSEFLLYKAGTINYFSSPSCCDKIVELSKGTETNATISSFSPESVPTCGNETSREVTIVAAAATGYKFNNGAELSYSGAGSATLVSATNGTAPYTWIYRLSANATGEGSFSVTSATAKNYAITLNGNGATTAGTASVNATYNLAELSAAISNPKKTDYIFQGWNTANDGSGLRVIDADGALIADRSGYTDENGKWIKDGTAELYAEWNEHSYINYRTNCCTEYEVELASSGVATGGTFEASKTSVCEGKEVTLTATPGTGYEFSSWTVMQGETDITSTKVAGNVLTMPAGNVTVEAAFDLIEYDITYHLNGGEGATNTTYTYESSSITLPTAPTVHKTGYTFLGWYNNSSFEGDPITTIPNHSTGDIELWANWIEDTQRAVTITAPSNGTITVSWNDGSAHSFTSGSQNIEIGTVLTIEAAGATGYDAGTITVNGAPLVGSTYTLDSDPLTIAATFSIHNYSITYNLNGGDGATNTTYTYESEAITLPTAPTVHKTGYTFLGWYDNSSFEGSAITTIAAGSTGDKQFWANWSINNYTLSWVTDGDDLTGNYTGKSGKVDYNTAIVAPETPTKTGYTFAGWYNGTSVVTPAATMPAEDVTYTATWTKNNYHVYFQNNGVTINEYTKEVAYEAQIGALPSYDANVFTSCDATSTTFKGWSSEVLGAKQESAPDYAESTDIMGAEDLYLHAVFAAEDEGPASSPINVFTQTETTAPTGYSIVLGGGAEAKTGYHQDGGGTTGTKRTIDIKKNSKLISVTPSSVTLTVNVGGGQAKDPLGNSVYAVWLDNTGAESGTPVEVANKIEVAGGKAIAVNLPIANASSAYGVRIYHSKEEGYNVRYYGVSLSYTVSSVDYSDYMTHCCSLVAVDNFAAVDNTSDTEVTLNWTALSSANQEGVTKLQVVDANNVVKVDNIAADAATATVTGLTKCDTYSFRVATVGASCTTYSEAVEARPFGSAKTVTFEYNDGITEHVVEATTCDADAVNVPANPIREGYRFMGWYNGESLVSTTTFEPTAASTTINATWAQEYTLHYNFNGASGAPADAKYIANEEVTLPADPYKNYLSTFTGWSYSTDVTSIEGGFLMPASNLTVTANFDEEAGQWFLVTDGSQMSAGQKVIIAAKNSNVAMSTTQNSSNRAQTSITKFGDVITAPSDNVQMFVLETGATSGTWAFKCLNGNQANKYIYAASSSNNQLKSKTDKDADGSWVLDVSIGKATAQGTCTNNILRHNSGNSLFACYGSANQDPIAFYHFVEGVFYSVNVQDVTGGTVTTDKYMVAAGETVTLTYTPKRGYTVGTLTVTDENANPVALSAEVTEGVTEYSFTMPSSDVTVAATFTAVPPVDYTLVESTDELAIGMQFILVGTIGSGNNITYWANGAYNSSKYLDATTVVAPNNKVIAISTEAIEELTLEGDMTAWELLSNAGKLRDSDKELLVDGTPSTWTFDITDGVATITSNGSHPFLFNANASPKRFRTYDAVNDQIHAVSMYALPTGTTFNLVIKNGDDSNKKSIKIAEGYTYSYTIKAADIPNKKPADDYEFLNKWTDGTAVYAVGDVVVVSEAKTLTPCWVRPLANNETQNATDITFNDIVVNNGISATIITNADAQLGNVTIKQGGSLTMSGEEVTPINDFIIEAQEGVSGQITNPEKLNINGNAYYDLTLNTSGKMDNSKWYAFAVPFQVDAASGIQRLSNDGKTSNAGFNSHYVLLKYNSAAYASASQGWEYMNRGETLEPGKFYMIALNSNEYNRVRMTKKAGTPLNNKADLTLETVGTGIHRNWNALANNALAYANVSTTGANAGEDMKVQVYNSAADSYTALGFSEVTFTVGTPFFFQAAEAGKMSVNIAASNNATVKAPAREAVATGEFQIRLGADTESYYDILYVSASDEALDDYEIGHDLAKSGVSTTVPQMYVPAYGGKLCDAEFPLVNNEATFPLTFTIPSAGTYQLYLADAPENANLYLQKNGVTVWDMTAGAYALEIESGTNTDYSLLLQIKEDTSTGVGTMNTETGAQKVIINEKVFILRGGKMYGIDGKAVK